MKSQGGAGQGKRGCPALLITILTLCLLLPGPTQVSASNGSTNLAIGATALGLVFTPLIAYGIYRNLPSQQGKEEKIFPGEFYVGGYLGASFAQNQDLKYEQGAILSNGVILRNLPPFTLFNNKFDPGVVGGWKFGYFLKSLPYLGLEVDMNFAPNRVRSQSLAASIPIQGSTQVDLRHDNWVNWTTAGHIVGRYGFFPGRAATGANSETPTRGDSNLANS